MRSDTATTLRFGADLRIALFRPASECRWMQLRGLASSNEGVGAAKEARRTNASQPPCDHQLLNVPTGDVICMSVCHFPSWFPYNAFSHEEGIFAPESKFEF